MRTLIMDGRIVSDAEKKVTQSGKEYVTFRFANDENIDKGQDGKPIPYWFRVTSYQPQHITLLKYLTKGKPLIVNGSYRDNVYQNRLTGSYEIGRDIIVDRIDFVKYGNEQNAQSNVSGATTSIPQPLKPQGIPQVTRSTTTVATPVTATPASTPTAAAAADSGIDDLPF